jgi:hypothetical protein
MIIDAVVVGWTWGTQYVLVHTHVQSSLVAAADHDEQPLPVIVKVAVLPVVAPWSSRLLVIQYL